MHEEVWGVEPEVIERWQVPVVWIMGRDWSVPGAKVARSARYGLWIGEARGELVVSASLRVVVAELLRRCGGENWEELARAVEEGRADVEAWPEDKYLAWLKAKMLAGVIKA